MCSQCNELDDEDYDDYEDEISMDDRWNEFYSWLEQLCGYECSELVHTPRGDLAEDDETESFFQNLISSFKSDFETNIDTDGVQDCKRRMSVRAEDRINTEQALNSMSAHEVMAVAVDLALYRVQALDETTARMSLLNVGIDFHDILWTKALHYEQADYTTSTL